LRHLLDASGNIQQAESQMSDMASEEGGEGSGGRRPMKAIARGSSSGSSGHRNAKVRLPKSEDYRPPKAFREDLLEALKEKYPKVYEDIIQKYYKRLVE
jgi:hypothetical protein